MPKQLFLTALVLLSLSAPAFAAEKKPVAAPAPAAPVVAVPAPGAAKPPAAVAPAAPAVAAPAAVAPAAPIAADTTPPPDTSNMMFLQNLRKSGATLYYLGQALGMHGWFAVKDKQVQIFYTSTDNRALLVGALLSPEGANISQQQIGLFAQSHPEIIKLLQGTSPSSAPPAASSVTPPASGATSAATGNAAPPPSAAAAPGTKPPSEAFYDELLKADQISFGKENAPTVLMVMDVNCPFCQQTWKKLEKATDEGRLRVIMIPIAALGAESATQGAVWLAQKNPQDVWKKYLAGDAKLLAGTPDPLKQEAIARNTALVVRWKVDHTPYLLYRGKNGKVRLIVGEPQSAETIINDING